MKPESPCHNIFVWLTVPHDMLILEFHVFSLRPLIPLCAPLRKLLASGGGDFFQHVFKLRFFFVPEDLDPGRDIFEPGRKIGVFKSLIPFFPVFMCKSSRLIRRYFRKFLRQRHARPFALIAVIDPIQQMYQRIFCGVVQSCFRVIIQFCVIGTIASCFSTT